jgi:hypothetical protein
MRQYKKRLPKILSACSEAVATTEQGNQGMALPCVSQKDSGKFPRIPKTSTL